MQKTVITAAQASALERLKNIKRSAGGGRGLSLRSSEDMIPGAAFTNPWIEASEGAEILPLEPALPPIEEDQDEHRVAARLQDVTTKGLGYVPNTNTEKYNDDKEAPDRVIRFLQNGASPVQDAQDIRTTERIHDEGKLTSSLIILP